MKKIVKKQILICIFIFIIFIFIRHLNIYFKNDKSFLVSDDNSLTCNNTELLSNQNIEYKTINNYVHPNEKFKENKFGNKMDKSTQQKESLNILINFHKACEKFKVKMYISHGTLLGAYRHKGFIPWDDDIDTTIFEDYIDIIHSDEFNKYLPKNIEVHKGYVRCDYDAYKTYCKLKGYDLNKKYNNNDFSVCTNLDNNVHIDIFHLNSIRQKNKIYYDLTSFGDSNNLITENEKNEMEPFQKIIFEGYYFNCPNNTQHILCKRYNKSIGIEGKLKNNTYYIDKNSNKGFDKPKHIMKGELYIDEDLQIKEKF